MLIFEKFLNYTICYMATSIFHANPFPGIRSYEINESHLFLEGNCR